MVLASTRVGVLAFVLGLFLRSVYAGGNGAVQDVPDHDGRFSRRKPMSVAGSCVYRACRLPVAGVVPLVGAMQRRKGASAERQVCAVDREFGFDSARTAPMQAGHGDEFPDVDCKEWPLSLLYREVKAYERVPVTRFVDEYVLPERPGFVNVLVHKDNHKPWIATLHYWDLVKFLAELRNLRSERDHLRSLCNPPFDGGNA